MQDLQVQVTGGVWAIAPIAEVPEVKLVDWRVFEVQQANRGSRTRHFVGSVGWHYDGQVSAAVVHFDPATRRGTTESGRVYQLVGPGSGLGMNADYTWSAWLQRCAATTVVDVTPEIE